MDGVSIDKSKWDDAFGAFVGGDIEAEAASKLRPLFDLLLEGLIFDQADWRNRVIATLKLNPDLDDLW